MLNHRLAFSCWARAAASALAVSACGGGTANAPAPNSSDEAAATEAQSAESTPSADPETASKSPAPEAASAEAASSEAPATSGPAVAELCSTLCDRVESKCSKKRAAMCRANCPDYVERATRCDAAVRSALTCLAEPGNVVCAPFAPEQCKGAVTAANACEDAAAPTAEATTQAALPAGWERISDSTEGFSVLLPKGAVKAREQDADVWRSKEGAVEYQLHISSAPERKDERQLLKAAWAFVGPECTPQLKLHGRIEKHGRVAVRFDSKCKDGASWHGIFHIAGGKLYRVAFKAPPGESGKLDLFVYGFEFTKR